MGLAEERTFHRWGPNLKQSKSEMMAAGTYFNLRKRKVGEIWKVGTKDI